jgi:hypothetical protein
MTQVESDEITTEHRRMPGAVPEPAAGATEPVARLPHPADLFCPECGYNLHGIEEAKRCPECGLAIDREGFGRSRIPWVHRRHVGRVRAYWRTVWMATARPKDLATEAARPVSFGDAQRFRYVTALLAALPFGAGLAGAMYWYGSAGFLSVIQPSNLGGSMTGGPPVPMFDVVVPWESGATLPPVLPLAALLAAVFVTGVASYWFHPRRLPVVRQNRAIALSYYACAPLAFASVPVLLFAAVAALRAAGLDDSASATWTLVRLLAIAGTVLSALLFLALWRSTLSLLKRTTQSGAARMALAAVLVPLKWLAVTAAVLIVVPWVVGYVRLVINSLR